MRLYLHLNAETHKRKLAENSVDVNVQTYCNGVENLGKRSKLSSDTRLDDTIIERERELSKTTARKSIANNVAKSLNKGMKIFEDERQKEEAKRLNCADTSVINCKNQTEINDAEKTAALNGVVRMDGVEAPEDTKKNHEKQIDEKLMGNDNFSACLDVDSLSDELIKNVFHKIRKKLSRRVGFFTNLFYVLL